MHPLNIEDCECPGMVEHRTILKAEDRLVTANTVTRTYECKMCHGAGFVTETFYPSACCHERILSSFGESYCSKCKKDVRYEDLRKGRNE